MRLSSGESKATVCSNPATGFSRACDCSEESASRFSILSQSTALLSHASSRNSSRSSIDLIFRAASKMKDSFGCSELMDLILDLQDTLQPTLRLHAPSRSSQIVSQDCLAIFSVTPGTLPWTLNAIKHCNRFFSRVSVTVRTRFDVARCLFRLVGRS